MTDQGSKPQSPPTPTPADGSLTPEQLQKAQDWLAAHWERLACPFHGPTKWILGDSLVGTVGFRAGGIAIGGPTFPLLVVTCSQCGFTAFLNAIVVGIIPPAPSPTPTEPTAKGPGGE